MFKTEAGTDIAMLGVWDASAPKDDIVKNSYKDFQAILDADAQAGKLLYVNTFSDGAFSVGVFTDGEQVPEELLEWYTAIDRKLFLNAGTGRVVVGGLEDYRRREPQITSEADVFEVNPGYYRVHAYQLMDDEERIVDAIKSEVGSDEYEYYCSRSTGCLAAFVALLLGLVSSFLWSWWAMAIAVVLSVAYGLIRSRINANDERYMAVKTAFDAWVSDHSVIVLVLERTDALETSDGFFDLDYESADEE